MFSSDNLKNKMELCMHVNVIHETLETNKEIFSFSTKPVSLKIYDFEEYFVIDLVYDNNTKESLEVFFNNVIRYRNKEFLKTAYPNHQPYYPISILDENNKDVVMNFSNSHVVLKSFINNTDVLTIYASKQHAYTSVNGHKRSIYDFEKYLNFTILSEEENNKINELYDKQYQKTEVVIPKKASKFSSNKKESISEEGTNISSLNFSENELKMLDPSILKIKNGFENSDEELNKLIGLDNVKDEIKKFEAKLEYVQKQKNRGIFNDEQRNMHMCFLGSPGTGKTTVARIVTGILYNLGYIKSNKCIEVNGQNLKGGYVGQTSAITKAVLRNAKNKLLFIDEAYSLYDDYSKGYGKDAVAVILKEMEDNRNDLIIIFAGYKNEMNNFLEMNSGLKSRINRFIDFDNYSPCEMLEILMLMFKKKSLYISKEALYKCLQAVKVASINPNFSNARFARNLIEKIEDEHIYNTHGIKDTNRKDTIELEDIPDEIIDELIRYSS